MATGRLREADRCPATYDCAWLWRAFLELSTCRAIGGGMGGGVIGPIPITATWAYIDRYQLPEWTVDAIVSLDASWREAEMAKPDPPAPAPPAPVRRPVEAWAPTGGTLTNGE